jgi:hypothetical protein
MPVVPEKEISLPFGSVVDVALGELEEVPGIMISPLRDSIG